ncbi:hypothetical protein FG379_000468 [Cryptosporidium bovis]|uniref:uncharacterized protein n=1 Tax=Cryptosporidium bovis TaxID=310047 RepID=UPI003519EF54|nr:hypothetical protein FG379_000468 [Cryptosporidium bovis]
MLDVSFHSEYSKVKSSWSLLELNQSCEKKLKSGNNIWIKGCTNDCISVPVVICTDDETFVLRRGKSSNITYLGLERKNDAKDSILGDIKTDDLVCTEKENESNSLNVENKNLNNDVFLIGEVNSIIFLIKTPGVISQIEHIMDIHRNETKNKNSDIRFAELFDNSQTSAKELYEYLFDYDSLMFCDVAGRWYSIGYDILLHLLSSVLQKGMSENISFSEMTLGLVKDLLSTALAELEENTISEYYVYYYTLKHALSFDFTLLQLVKHFIVVPRKNKLFNMIFPEFNFESYINMIKEDNIEGIMNGKSDLSDMRITLSHKRIQKIIAINILIKNPILKVKDYVHKFQEMSSDYIPLEIYEMEFEKKNTKDSIKSNTDTFGSNAAQNIDSSDNTDFYFGFPCMENHPDNTGVRFDVISGNAYYNEEDDTIRYLPNSKLPTDPRSRLATLFKLKKYWHISEISSFVSPVLPSTIKIEEFCISNCYFCEKNLLGKNLDLFYNKNLPLY